MDIYKYTKLASESGKDGLIAIAIFAALFTYILYRMMNKSGGDLSQSKVLVIVVIVAFFAFAANNVMKRVNSKGSWDITVDDKVIQWNAPDGIEPSFVINLGQINAMQTTLSQDLNVKSYDLIMSDGQEVRLGETSGINFDELAVALAARGVKLTEVVDHPSQ